MRTASRLGIIGEYYIGRVNEETHYVVVVKVVGLRAASRIQTEESGDDSEQNLIALFRMAQECTS